MTTMSDLPEDLTKEIFSRVPLTSLSIVRSTCKKWNSISKSEALCESLARRKQFLGFIMKGYRVCSMKFDLQGIQNEADIVDPSINQVGLLDHAEISQIFQCEGLLLCVTRDMSRLLVWNPYLGQTLWIQPRNSFHKDRYAIGYDKNRNYKILRILGEFGSIGEYMVRGYEIFDLSCTIVKVQSFNAEWSIDDSQCGVSLKGQTYFLSEEKIKIGGYNIKRILSFNYTTDKFGNLLPLPFNTKFSSKFVLSCVREEKLAVLHQICVIDHAIEIWVTNKIDPGEVSWSKFLRFAPSCILAGSFFLDEEKRIAVVVDLENRRANQTAYIIGQGGYFKSVNIREASSLGKRSRAGYMIHDVCHLLLCSSYAPCSVQLQNQPSVKVRRK